MSAIDVDGSVSRVLSHKCVSYDLANVVVKSVGRSWDAFQIGNFFILDFGNDAFKIGDDGESSKTYSYNCSSDGKFVGNSNCPPHPFAPCREQSRKS